MENFLELEGSAGLAIAWQVAWQSTAILLVGLAASRIVSMRPSRSHRILLASAVACLIVQPASLIARRYDFGLFAPAVRAEPAPALDSAARPSADAAPLAAMPPRPIPAALPAMNPPSAPVVTSLAVNDEQPARPARSAFVPPEWFKSLSWIHILLAGWGLLTALGLVRLATSFVMGLRLKRDARPIESAAMLEASRKAAVALGLSQPPEVRVSSRVHCPVVWCWGVRPVLILPATTFDASLTARGELAAILCHELAHWKRADHVSALISEVLTCLLPWQPLAWIYRARMDDLSELACDDWALTHAQAVSPPDYADALLGLAVERRRPLVPAAISRKSGLVTRIQHILKETPPMPQPGNLWSTLTACLTLGLVTLLAVAHTRQAVATSSPPSSSSVEDQAAEPAKDVTPTTINGVVKDKDGHPIPGAEVVWIGESLKVLTHVAMPHDHPDYGKRITTTYAKGTTDEQGRFTFTAPVERTGPNRPYSAVFAYKKGFTPMSKLVLQDGKSLEVSLKPPATITGRLITPAGDPAPDAVVRITYWSIGEIGNDPSNVQMTNYSLDGEPESLPSFFPGDFRTDADGKFVIEGFVPENSSATLSIHPKGFAVDEITVNTGENTKPTQGQESFSIQPLPKNFTHTLSPERPVVGTVTDAETKKPIPGLTVEVTAMGRHGGMPVRTVTDEQGHYRVSDKEGQMYWINAYPAAASGYLPASESVMQWPEGQSELRVDLALNKGIVIHGKVIDADTGQPIPNAGIVYQPKRGNPNVPGGRAEFRSPTLTKADGTFAISGVRGPGVIVAEAPSLDYIRYKVDEGDFGIFGKEAMRLHGYTRFDAPAEGDAPEVTVKLKKGITLEARAVRPDGSTVNGLLGWCHELKARMLENWESPEVFLDGTFRLEGAEPGRTYRVFLLSQDLKHGKLAELKADPNQAGPLEVKLEPTASAKGRVVNADGTPIEGAQILPNIQLVDKGAELTERDRFEHGVLEVYTMFTGDPLKQVYPADFEYKGLIPGVRYFVTWYSFADRKHEWKAIEPLQPGEHREVGDIKSDKKEAKDGN